MKLFFYYYLFIIMLLVNSCVKKEYKGDLMEIRQWERCSYSFDSIESFSDTVYNDLNYKDSLEGLVVKALHLAGKDINSILQKDTNGIWLEQIIILKKGQQICDSVLKIRFNYLHKSCPSTIYYYSFKNGIFAKAARDLIFLSKVNRMTIPVVQSPSYSKKYLKYFFLQTQFIRDHMIDLDISKDTIDRFYNLE